MYRTIEDIERANHAAGHHWFEPATMRFFRSRVLDTVYHGRYFVTSERGPSGARRYSVRVAMDDGSVGTVGPFQAYATRAQAIRAARALSPVSVQS